MSAADPLTTENSYVRLFVSQRAQDRTFNGDCGGSRLWLQDLDAQNPLNLCRIVAPFQKCDTRKLWVSIGQPDFFYFKEARAIRADAFVIRHASQIVRVATPQQQGYLLLF